MKNVLVIYHIEQLNIILNITKLKALRDIFRIILEDINSYNTINHIDDQTSLNINRFQHLRMAIGGGVDDEKNLNRKSVMMLNDPTINLEEKLETGDYQCLYEKLKNNVIILPPVTYLLNNDNEDEGILKFFLMKIHQIK